ncbi:MAG: hypothetical protein SPF70_10735 [Lachnospiraceae bacterium]|nr:hypothetical protein [Lachnospiraceae bacterium]
MRRKICRQAEALLLVGVMLIGNTIYFPDRISAQENESIENIPWIEIHSYYLDGENMDAEYFVPKTDNNCYLYYEGEELLIRGIGNR